MMVLTLQTPPGGRQWMDLPTWHNKEGGEASMTLTLVADPPLPDDPEAAQEKTREHFRVAVENFQAAESEMRLADTAYRAAILRAHEHRKAQRGG